MRTTRVRIQKNFDNSLVLCRSDRFRSSRKWIFVGITKTPKVRLNTQFSHFAQFAQIDQLDQSVLVPRVVQSSRLPRSSSIVNLLTVRATLVSKSTWGVRKTLSLITNLSHFVHHEYDQIDLQLCCPWGSLSSHGVCSSCNMYTLCNSSSSGYRL